MTEGRLPDPTRSRALLLGTSVYHDPALPDLPAVGNNLADLAEVLTSSWATALGPDHCVVVADETDREAIGQCLNAVAVQSDDLLLVYYAGHGLIGPDGELYLSLPNTRSERALVSWTALPFSLFRHVLAGARAKNRVLILDCCFSGLAIDHMTDLTSAVAGQLAVAGTCTLTSSPANRTSGAPSASRHTAYTGELLRLLCRGSADCPGLLTLTAIHEHLERTLPTLGFPRPEQRNTRTIGRLALARNRYQPDDSASANSAETLSSRSKSVISPNLAAVHLTANLNLGRRLRLRGSRVLWVDDRHKPDVLPYEGQVLRELGIAIDTALSTEDALDKLHNERPPYRLIVSDMRRPPDLRAGFTLLDRIRQGGDKTPFIIFTGFENRSLAEEARQHGAADLTDDPKDFMRIVTEHLARRT